MPTTVLDDWGLNPEELSEIIAENPSMRGLMFGFVAEYKLKKEWLLHPEITQLWRPRSRDRKAKGDFGLRYRGQDMRLEVKCLDTPKVSFTADRYFGTFQCNASDTTKVLLPNAETVVTNCLAVGGFDVLAVCLFAFGSRWHFAFAVNDDLPRSTWRGYTPEQQRWLLKSTMRITEPLAAPYSDDLFAVLDRAVAAREAKARAAAP